MVKIDSKRQKTFVLVTVIIIVLVGIITTVYGILNIENYYHPYLFVLIFGGQGLVIGLIISSVLKPYFAFNKKQHKNFLTIRIYFSIGFIGILLLTVSVINKSFSRVDYCNHYKVIDKARQEKRFRVPEINSLYVIINGDRFSLICHHAYWDRISIGQEINLCIHHSRLGFDFVSLTDDK